MEYLESENRYTETFFTKHKTVSDALFEEMQHSLPAFERSWGWTYGPYRYFFEKEAQKNYRTFCRTRIDGAHAPEIIFDENAWAEGKEFFQVGDYCISPDHEYLAITVDTIGDERYTLFLKNLTTGTISTIPTPALAPQMAWDNSGKKLLVIYLNEKLRPYALWQYALFTEQQPTLMFTELDEKFYLDVALLPSHQWWMLTSSSADTSEIWIARADQPAPLFCVVIPRKKAIEYQITDHPEGFFVRTNAVNPNFDVLWLDPELKNNRTITAPSVHWSISDCLAIGSGFLVLHERHIHAVQRLRIIDLDTKAESILTGEHASGSLRIEHPLEMHADSVLYYSYTDLKTPKKIYALHLKTMEKQLLHEEPAPADYTPDDWILDRQYATAADGTRIPISMMYAKNLQKPAALDLYAYGAYGIALDSRFSPYQLCLLKRGVIISLAHIRGGGDGGPLWHQAGKASQKMNTFEDCIAATEFLIEQGYTKKQFCSLRGGSAGGLMVGAVIQKKPELFAAAIAEVPFVDCLNTMLDKELPLTITEYDEWGDPNTAQGYQAIASYAPYEQVRAQALPALLVTAGLQDGRVGYWEPAKWVAKLRYYQKLSSFTSTLLLSTEMQGGHFGASGRLSRLQQLAQQYSFLLAHLPHDSD